MPLHSLPFKKAKQKQHRGYPYLPHPHAAFSFVTDKALMRILHVPLFNSLNPRTGEEHWALFVPRHEVCFPLHDTLEPKKCNKVSPLLEFSVAVWHWDVDMWRDTSFSISRFTEYVLCFETRGNWSCRAVYFINTPWSATTAPAGCVIAISPSTKHQQHL